MASPHDLKELDAWDITGILGAFLAAVAPGMLIILIYAPHLVYELETIKVLVLSTAFTLPLIALNAFIVACIGPFTRSIGSGPGTRKHLFFWLATWAFLTYYSALAIAYFYDLGVGAFIAAVFLFNIAYGILILWITRFLVSVDP